MDGRDQFNHPRSFERVVDTWLVETMDHGIPSFRLF